MNKQETDIFFSLIRNALWASPQTPSSWTGKWNWKTLLAEVETQALQTLLANSILSLPDSYLPDTDSQNRLTQLLALNMREHVRLNADIARLFDAMHRADIHPILMKGQSLAGYYPNPLFRKCGDVDIYVGEDNMERVAALMEGMEAKRMEKDCSEKHDVYMLGKTEVEAHRYPEIVSLPQSDSAYQCLVGEYSACCESITIGGTEVAVFPPQFLPLYLCYHIWHHVKTGGIGFRQLCDWTLVLHRLADKLDTERLRSDLQLVGMLPEWRILGSVLVQRMGLPASSFPLYEELPEKKVDCLVRLFVEDGNFSIKHDWLGFKGPYFFRKLRSFCIHTCRYLLLARVSFPVFLRTYKSWMKIRWTKFEEGK